MSILTNTGVLCGSPADDTVILNQTTIPLDGPFSHRFNLLGQELTSLQRDVEKLLRSNASSEIVVRFLFQNLAEIHNDAKELIAICLGKTSPRKAYALPCSDSLETLLEQLRTHRRTLRRWAMATQEEFCLSAPIACKNTKISPTKPPPLRKAA